MLTHRTSVHPVRPRSVTRLLLLGPVSDRAGGAVSAFSLLVDEPSKCGAVHVEVVPTGGQQIGLFRRTLHSPFVLFRLIQRMSRHDAIAIHASQARFLWMGAIVRVLAKVMGKPLVMRAFGGDLDRVFARSGRFQRRLFDWVLGADAVLLETQQLRDAFTRGFPDAHVHWFANSRRIGAVPGVRRDRTEGMRFVFVGQVKPSKGISDLLAAGRLLQAADSPVRIDVYGPLIGGIDTRDFEGSAATYCGELAPENVVQTMAQYDALVLPTWYAGEGHPGVILEASSVGLPVIATDWRAISELVEHEVNGLLIPTHDPMALRRAMVRLADDPLLLTRLRRGVRKVSRQFSSVHWNRDVFLDICRGVIERRSAPLG